MALIPGLQVHIVHPPKPVKRTWRERLFSRPWTPLRAYRVPHCSTWEHLQARRGCFLQENVLFCTPEFFSEVQKNTYHDAFADLMRP